MTYEIVGSNVSLSLSADEMNEVIEALELANADSELLEDAKGALQAMVAALNSQVEKS